MPWLVPPFPPLALLSRLREEILDWESFSVELPLPEEPGLPSKLPPLFPPMAVWTSETEGTAPEPPQVPLTALFKDWGAPLPPVSSELPKPPFPPQTSAVALEAPPSLVVALTVPREAAP